MKLREVDTGIAKLEPEATDRDHRFFRVLCPAGHYIGQTKRSHKPPTTDITADLVGKMAHQLHVTMPFFRDLVACTKGRRDYLEVRGHPDCGTAAG